MDTNFPAFAPADAYSSYPEGDEYYTKGGAPADANGYAPPAYRHLLAAGDYKDPCPEGTSQLFPISVLHAVHIMLFLVAATQILYSCTVLILCLWRVSLWRKYELRAQNTPGLLHHLDKDYNGCGVHYKKFKRKAVGHLTSQATQNIAMHYSVSSLLMFNSVNGEQYIIMRHIFLQNLGLENDFDFLEFVKESMEEEFASMVGVNTFMWMILFVWVALPPETYVSIWIPLLVLLLAMVLGAKLSSVMLIFSHQARQAWASSKEAEAELEASMKGRSAPSGPGPVAEAEESSDVFEDAVVDVEAPSTNPTGALTRVRSASAMARAYSTVHEVDEEALGAESALPQRVSEVSTTSAETSHQPSTAEETPKKTAQDAQSKAQTESDLNAINSEIQNAFAYPGDGTKRKEKDIKRGCCWSPAADEEPAEHSGDSKGNGDGKRYMDVRVQKKGKWKTMKIDANALNIISKNKKWMEKKYMAQDSANLFWGRKPYIILHLLQIVYFGMSMQLALAIFTVWLDLPVGYLLPVFASQENHDIDDPISPWAVVFMVSTNVFILLWCSFNLLPAYAIASTVGSHCPQSVLEFAHKTHVQPQLARALEAVALLNSAAMQDEFSDTESELGGPVPRGHQTEDLIDDIIDAHLDKGTPVKGGADVGHPHPKQRAMQKLMGAMYSAQLKRFTSEAMPLGTGNGTGQHPHGESTWHASDTQDTSSLSSFSQIQNMFYDSDAPANLAGETPTTTVPKLPLQLARDSPNPDIQRLALKQEFLLSIVGRQEDLKKARESDNDTPLPSARGAGEKRGGAPAGFCLGRHSMAARVSMDKTSASATVPPSESSGAQASRTFAPRTLGRRSLNPAMQQQQPSRPGSETGVPSNATPRTFSLARQSAMPVMQHPPTGQPSKTSAPPPPTEPVHRVLSRSNSLARRSDPAPDPARQPAELSETFEPRRLNKSLSLSRKSAMPAMQHVPTVQEAGNPLFEQQQNTANVANASLKLARVSSYKQLQQ